MGTSKFCSSRWDADAVLFLKRRQRSFGRRGGSIAQAPQTKYYVTMKATVYFAGSLRPQHPRKRRRALASRNSVSSCHGERGKSVH